MRVRFVQDLLRHINSVWYRSQRDPLHILFQFCHPNITFADLSRQHNTRSLLVKAELFKDVCIHECDYTPSEYLLNAVVAHMGQWTEDKDERPFTSIDRCVHLADYMASRNFIDIPSITEEWHNVEYEMCVNGDLPF